MGWAQSVTNLTLKVAGSTVGDSSGSTNKTILSATFGHGRPDWFASLSPGSASFTLLGDLTGSIDPGDSLELLRGTDELWTGKVDSVVLNEAPGEPDTTTVTGADFVAQLGEAKVKGLALAEDTMEAQLEDVLAEAGYTTTVTRAPSTGSTYLAMDASYTGSVMDWIETAERGANCITAWMPDGEVRVCRRASFPDYGQRIWDSDAAIVNMPGLPLASSLWRMDEGSGNIVDLINARDGTAAGTPTYGATGPWGASGPDAIEFTKSDAADEFVVGDFYDLTGAGWTVAGWVYWSGNSSSRSTIMSKIASGPSGWLLNVETNGGLRFQALDSGSSVCAIVTAAGTISVNTWTHVAVRLSSGSIAVLKDGVIVGGPTALSGSIPNTAASLRIGSNAGATEWMAGRLCMWAIWSGTALSQALVSTLIDLDYVTLPTPMTWTVSRSITSVINHWLVGGTTYSDSTSISTYGRRTWDADDSTSLVLPTGPYYSNLRTTMKDPRPIVTATFSVTSTSSVLITIAPLGLALYDGTLYQVLDVRHDVSPSEWTVTLVLDRTQSDLTDDVPILPV